MGTLNGARIAAKRDDPESHRVRPPSGFVTFNQLNELLPSTTTAPEDIEALLEALSDEGIHVIEGE
jgi:hypothetical protein